MTIVTKKQREDLADKFVTGGESDNGVDEEGAEHAAAISDLKSVAWERCLATTRFSLPLCLRGRYTRASGSRSALPTTTTHSRNSMWYLGLSLNQGFFS